MSWSTENFVELLFEDLEEVFDIGTPKFGNYADFKKKWLKRTKDENTS